MVYHVKVRIFDSTEWVKPTFPKSCKNLDILIEDSKDLLHVYDAVAIFNDKDEMVMELVRA